MASIVSSGRRAMAYMEHNTPGFVEPSRITPKPAVASGSLDLRTLFVLPPSSQTTQTITHNSSPIVPVVSKLIPLDAALIENSKVASLGSSIIVAAQRDMASTAAGPALYRDAGRFRTLEPAAFGLVADGAQAAAGAIPWHDASISWPDAPSIAFNVTLTRRELKDVGGGDMLEANLMQSIITGLARAADACLLAAIVAAAPSVFTIAAAAARGLSFPHLGAVIGTNGDGAAVDSYGVLRALGVPAELTNTIAKTIIGDFHKSAVAIFPEVQAHVTRLNADGSLQATIFANMLPLLPSADAFWLGA
ncbi:hypothetical protein PY254_11510 [Rhodanobacter sp. AS-Z3]|uniref:hypothetical protein n=1 Tax=Rhodanobacter sp. AS-Z3 TaxID=3031330 RepID=UPI00247AD90E|nr:hypothetical protein [Rhodanobacter sp. AS-Z3]WEN13869.1 hypothetical protein PY254_11510 [Rhodanobacter sp. AS-Z3]